MACRIPPIRIPLGLALLLLISVGVCQTMSGAMAQSAGPVGTGMIVGRVVDGQSGAPISGVVVTLVPLAGSPAAVVVDSRGRFAFPNVAAGSITIRAEKNGYLTGGIGRTRADGQTQPLDLSQGERILDLNILMWRRSSIEGTVLDERGEPVVGVPIEVLLRSWTAGRPSFSRFAGNAVTDDRGMYHFGEAWPGEYIVAVSSRVDSYPSSFIEAEMISRQVSPAERQTRTTELNAKGSNRMGVTPSSASLELDGFRVAQADARDGPIRATGGRLWIFPFTFHPAARTLETATIVRLGPGEQRKGVDVRLTLSPTSRVSGIARGPDGPIGNLALRLRLVPRGDMRLPNINIAETVTDTSGAFTFFGVPAGQYVIVANTTAIGSTPSLWALQPIVTTERDETDVQVALRPALRVSGRVEFDGASPKPTPQQMRALVLSMDPSDGTGPRASLNIDPDGNFRNATLVPGHYFIRVIGTTAPIGGVSAAAGLPWTLKSSIVNGRDVADSPLSLESDIDGVVVTFTDRPASLSGTARTSQGDMDPAAAVIVFPADAAMWTNSGGVPRRFRNVRTDRAGRFLTTNLPPGEYFVVAIADSEAGPWQDPKFLAAAARMATRVKVEEARAASVELRTQRW